MTKARWKAVRAMLACLALAGFSAGCQEKWDVSQHPPQEQELDAAFFSGLDSKDIPDVPEPRSLRPCCIFGNDVGVQVGSVPVPGYEVRNVLDINGLGTHQYNKGTLALQPSGSQRLVSNEASGILYTCRGGFVDLAHVRDNADRTLYLVDQIARIAATGGTIPIVGEGAERRVVVKPLDARLVRAHGLRDVVIALAEWVSFQASIWHEITTWYGWSSTAFSERPSAFSPEDLYSNLIGIKITGAVMHRHAATSEVEYNNAVTAILKDALTKLGPLPQTASRRAFEYVDGIWWNSEKRVPDNQLVRHRNFNIGPTLLPWKLKDAQLSAALTESATEFDQYCQSDWTPLALTVPERLDDVPFRTMATLEITPEDLLVKNGFPFPRAGSKTITEDDFPAIIATIERAADVELGPGTGRPAARPGEKSRLVP